MDAEKCVSCGTVIPEGRQVCPSCESNKITNPVKAIRAYCLECSGDSTAEVKYCPRTVCSLYPFRMGKNPYRQRREMSEEQKQVLADRLKEARKSLADSGEKTEVGDD